MADVYLGRHTTLNRPMAVKILHPHMTVNPELRRRFRDEAQAVAALRHPNIVQVSDFDVIEDRPYIVMELLDGMSMAEYLRVLHGMGNSLPLDTIARLVGTVSSALDYAHNRGIVHRDVKPANIILRAGSTPINSHLPLGPDVEPVLTDFGVARIATSTTPTISGTILGTPAYMSPEQVRGEPVDRRSDIYSLGIILYEVLAGKLPFDPETDTPASILYKHVNEKPPQLADVSPAIQAVVHKALAKDREARYQRAGQLAADVQAAIRAIPSAAATEALVTEVGRPSVPAQPIKPSKKSSRPTIALLGGLGLAALVLIGGVVLGGRLVGGTDEPVATAPLRGAAVPTHPEAAVATEPVVQVGPTATDLSVDTAPAVFAFIQDSNLELRIPQVEPPPSGLSYHAWLLGGEGVEPLDLKRDGSVELLGGVLLVSYSHPKGVNLLALYQTLVISLEPEGSVLVEPSSQVVFSGTVLPDTPSYVRLADDVNRGRPIQVELLSLMKKQIGHFFSHSGFALDAIGSNNLPAVKLHSEHTLNIIDGREGNLFADWDNNGRAENPGDDVGLLPYVRLLEAAAAGSAVAAEQRGGSGELGRTLAARAAEIAIQLANATETARKILLADSTSDIRSFGLDSELQVARGLKDQLAQLAAEAQNLDLVFLIQLTPTS